MPTEKSTPIESILSIQNRKIQKKPAKKPSNLRRSSRIIPNTLIHIKSLQRDENKDRYIQSQLNILKELLELFEENKDYNIPVVIEGLNEDLTPEGKQDILVDLVETAFPKELDKLKKIRYEKLNTLQREVLFEFKPAEILWYLDILKNGVRGINKGILEEMDKSFNNNMIMVDPLFNSSLLIQRENIKIKHITSIIYNKFRQSKKVIVVYNEFCNFNNHIKKKNINIITKL